MTFVARILSDLRHLMGHLLLITGCTFLVAVAANAGLATGLRTLGEQTLFPQPPQEPLSFIRVLDPEESLAHEIDPRKEPSLFDSPGLATLLTRMEADPRMLMVLPLGALTSSRQFPAMADRGVVVLGTPPPHMAAETGDATPPVLFGDAVGEVHTIHDDKLGPIPLHRRPPLEGRISMVSGHGSVVNVSGDGLLWLRPADARRLGVYPPYSAQEMTESFVCACDATDMDEVVRAMNTAERRQHGARRYHSVSYQGLIGPVENSQSASVLLRTLTAAATVAVLLTWLVASAGLLWQRIRPTFLTEALWGAGRVTLVCRQQILLGLAVLAPLAAAWFLSEILIGPMDWPPVVTSTVPVALLVGQLLLGAWFARELVRSIHHLHTTGGAR